MPCVGFKIVVFRIIHFALKRKRLCQISRVTRKPNVFILNERLKADYKQADKKFVLSLVRNNGRCRVDSRECDAEGHVCLTAYCYIYHHHHITGVFHPAQSACSEGFRCEHSCD